MMEPAMEINLSLHPQQSRAFKSPATEILYGGAAGGGKSHLMRVTAIVLCASIPGLQVYLFRRHFADLYKNHLEGAGSFIELLASWIVAKRVKLNLSKNELVFWNGSKIHLCHVQHDKDMLKYQGAEIHVLLMDELTHFSEKVYRFLRGRCRLGGLKVPDNWKHKLPLIFAGSNPGGVGHLWVKRTFVTSARPMECHRATVLEGGMLRQYVPAKLTDNPTLLNNDPDYVTRLEGLGEPALVKAMLNGDWNIVAGGALDDAWSDRLIIPRFVVPHCWRLDRAFDWGSTHPFSVGWWAEADGTEAKLPDGSIFCPPKGSLIQIAEWYGSKEVGTNKGLGLGSDEIALGIKERENDLKALGLIKSTIHPGPADNQIRNVIDARTPTIEKLMRDNGVTWTASDKSPGSRVIGLELLRARMKEAKKAMPERPSIYFTESCLASLAVLPILPRDENKPEDVDTDAEDHCYDMVRYRVLATARAAMNINMKTVM